MQIVNWDILFLITINCKFGFTMRQLCSRNLLYTEDLRWGKKELRNLFIYFCEFSRSRQSNTKDLEMIDWSFPFLSATYHFPLNKILLYLLAVRSFWRCYTSSAVFTWWRSTWSKSWNEKGKRLGKRNFACIALCVVVRRERETVKGQHSFHQNLAHVHEQRENARLNFTTDCESIEKSKRKSNSVFSIYKYEH